MTEIAKILKYIFFKIGKFENRQSTTVRKFFEAKAIFN